MKPTYPMIVEYIPTNLQKGAIGEIKHTHGHLCHQKGPEHHHMIRTSPIVKIHENGDIETENSIYHPVQEL